MGLPKNSFPALTLAAAWFATQTAAAENAESPFARFRDILDLPENQRAIAIEGLNPNSDNQARVIRSKVQEYLAMPELERNRRLEALDFRWHLLSLLKSAPADRDQNLAVLPERFRPEVEKRLGSWDQLDKKVRENLWKNQTAYHFLMRHRNQPHGSRTNALKRLPSKYRQKVEADIAHWRRLSSAERREMCEHFHRFFNLPQTEQQQTLHRLPRGEQTKMQASIDRFRLMSPAQRKVCIQSLQKLADMSREERARFLRNAERWQTLKPEERKSWRTLVQRMPPLPPGFGAQPNPPLPPGIKGGLEPVRTAQTNRLR